MDRVTILRGTAPVLIVAPHGHDLDDTNTSQLAELLAVKTGSHLVANNGWRRSQSVDGLLGLANCNHAKHVLEDVVKEEFYDPIKDAIDNMMGMDEHYDPFADDPYPQKPLVLMIHGIGNGVRKTLGEPELDVIVGFGKADKPRITCDRSRRQFFVDLLAQKVNTYEGKAGGNYSAYSYNNVTQMIHRNFGVDVLQLELVGELREKAALERTASDLASVVDFMDQMPDGYSRDKAKIVVKEV